MADSRLLQLGQHLAPPAGPAAPEPAAGVTDKPKLCIIATVWYYLSHAQHEGDRFNHGWPMNGKWHHPEVELVSVYVDQKPGDETHGDDPNDPDGKHKGDLSAARQAEWPGLTVYASIEEALRCGTDKIAVDCVLIIGEHGNYELDEYEMTRWPRYEWFKRVTDVFRSDGKVCPVFNDKHLSWNWEWAKEMVATSYELSFPFMAGSGLSVSWRMPSNDLPYGAGVEESFVIGGGWPDGGSFHMVEFTQTLLERRKGGESGVLWVEAMRGPSVWEKLKTSPGFENGTFDPALLETALCRCHNLAQARPGYSARHPTPEEMAKLCESPMLFRWQYTDGTRATMMFGNGLVGDYAFAAKLHGEDEHFSTMVHLGGTNIPYSACLMHSAESMFVGKDGFQPFPIERTLVATGVNAAGMHALRDGGQVSLPGLEAVRYVVSDDPRYAGGGGMLG